MVRRRKKKLSAALKGIKKSPETRARISAGLKGKKLSPEHVAQIRQSKLGKKWTPAQRMGREKVIKKGSENPCFRHDVSTEEITRLYAAGMGMRAVAARLGQNYALIHDRLTKAGVQKRKNGRPRVRPIKKAPVDSSPLHEQSPASA
jgi:hypothetical protein